MGPVFHSQPSAKAETHAGTGPGRIQRLRRSRGGDNRVVFFPSVA